MCFDEFLTFSTLFSETLILNYLLADDSGGIGNSSACSRGDVIQTFSGFPAGEL